MSDKFYRIPIECLFKWIINEEESEMIFGLYKNNLFKPDKNDPFRMSRYGQLLETPIGLEIDADSPEEIAISIAAEVIKVKNIIEFEN